MSTNESYVECLRDIIDFLRNYLPPDADFAVPLYDSLSATYFLSREGVFISQKRVEEHLPFLSKIPRRISLEYLPQSILRSIDLCDLIKGIIKENMRWLNLNNENHVYYITAKRIVSDKGGILRLFKCS